MKTVLFVVAALAVPLPALAQSSDPVVKRALQLCGPMPACIQLVERDILPGRFVVACATALDQSEPEGPIKANARRMCNTALTKMLEKEKEVAHR